MLASETDDEDSMLNCQRMLLYLHADTWVSPTAKQLAAEVADALNKGLERRGVGALGVAARALVHARPLKSQPKRQRREHAHVDSHAHRRRRTRG